MNRRWNNLGAAHATRAFFSEREWKLAAGDAPPIASHVVTSRSGYTHHGIYVGDGKVVHYAGLARGLRTGPVEEVSLAEFARGRSIWIRPYNHPRFDRHEVVARARSRLGENRYRVWTNNCEHFSEWCVRGEHRSRQVDAWRTWPQRLLATAFAVVYSLGNALTSIPGSGAAH
jgi:Lecithin retinol acyltransferase